MADAADERKPSAGRVPKAGGKSTNLKVSIGKEKLHADPSMARMIYQTFVINGVQYCRPHLMLYCHICEENYDTLRREVDEERAAMGLRPGGDPALTSKAERWMQYISSKQLENNMEIDMLIQKYGRDHATTHPQHWQNLTRKFSREEREINDRFLQEVRETFENGASECCYWACKTPDAEKLFRCVGCGIAKYCCKEHQRLDWHWEHKGECQQQVPQFLKDEIEEQRQRNLRGDYTERQRV